MELGIGVQIELGIGGPNFSQFLPMFFMFRNMFRPGVGGKGDFLFFLPGILPVKRRMLRGGTCVVDAC